MTALSPTRVGAIVPVHDVAAYLPEFLRSLDAQGDALPAQILFIDDGSTDASGELIDAWIAGGHETARRIRTENHGVSAARNRGLDEIAADWAVFLDPDDVLASGYFSALLSFLGEHPEVDLAATNLLRLQEPDTRLRDNHPLRFRFAGGDRVAELADDVFVMNAASVAFPMDAVRRSGARFPAGLHASEDALFVAQYLLSLGRSPVAGFVAGARYGYRKRQARTSAVDRYRSDPSTYTVRFHEGYAPLLERAATAGGVPCWLQSVLLYEMQWLLPVQMDPQRFAENLDDAQRAETLAGLARCLRHVGDDRLIEYDASALPLECRLLILALTDRPLWDWVGAYATLPRGWREAADVIVYRSAYESDDLRDAAAPAEHLLAWAPDYFGQKVLTAHRLRTRQRDGAVAGAEIIWPRPGETLAQTQDRHRRRVAGVDADAIPALDGEVYVRRTRTWTGDADSSLRRVHRRRHVWSKDAMIGRLLRPGRALLIEDDGERRLTEIAARLEAMSPAHLVASPSAPSSGSWRFGSLRHRIARARARALVCTLDSTRPSPRARLRGLRVLVVTDPLGRPDLLRVRRLAPDLVLVRDAGDVSLLAAAGVPAGDVLQATGTSAEDAARALIARLDAIHRNTSRRDARAAA